MQIENKVYQKYVSQMMITAFGAVILLFVGYLIARGRTESLSGGALPLIALIFSVISFAGVIVARSLFVRVAKQIESSDAKSHCPEESKVSLPLAKCCYLQKTSIYSSAIALLPAVFGLVLNLIGYSFSSTNLIYFISILSFTFALIRYNRWKEVTGVEDFRSEI